MIKTTILAVTILFLGTMMVDEVYAPDILNIKAIPGWVDNVMRFYLDGQISEREMLDAFDYLFKNNIMHMSQEAAQEVAELRAENKQLHQQMAQYRESDLDFTQRMQERSETHDMAKDELHGDRMAETKQPQANEPESWDYPDDPTRFDQAHSLGPEVIQKKHIASKIAMVPITDENGVETPLLVSVPDGVDVNAFVQSVLRESYMETNKDLQFYADKVRYYNDMKEAIRDHMTEMRNERQMAVTQFENANQATTNPDVATETTSYDRLTMKADLDEHEGTISEFLVLQKELETIETDIEDLTQKIDSAMILQKTLKKDLILLEDSNTRGVFPTKVVLSDGVKVLETQEQWEAEIKSLEDKLSSAGDDAQLANIDLQNALQKQQQTLQTMSNVSKMLHDTAMSIIRKIG